MLGLSSKKIISLRLQPNTFANFTASPKRILYGSSSNFAYVIGFTPSRFAVSAFDHFLYALHSRIVFLLCSPIPVPPFNCLYHLCDTKYMLDFFRCQYEKI